MANFVLVHGAWSGNYTFEAVERELRAAGHVVLNSALMGIGTRQAELHPGITLTDHVDDLCEQVEQAGFGRFILVGHSYGGMVITGAAARLGNRIDAICYLDAFVPEDGESVWDLIDPVDRAWHIDEQRLTPGLVPLIGIEEFRPVPGLIGYQPLFTMLEAVRLTGEEARIPRRAFVFATDWFPQLFTRFAEKVRNDPAWEYHEAPCSHYVMVEQPELTTRVLLGLAS